MSESEVSQIRDEDVLRRMWQQTEDFSRKKEIRAHMYRLREERLRNLYSPEPTPDGKGCEFTSAQGHVKSFADQNFQSMKSKEVRDAGSPPKDFAYRGQDLKELSNAGWNVESEDRTTDDGRTHVKSVNANIEGRYDVEGGRGQFAAVDRQRQAITEHHDDHSSLRRDETSSDTAAHEHVVRQLDDGTRFSSTTSSSNTSSKFQQVSSTKHETVPYVTDDDYDQARRTAHDTNRNEQVTRTTNKNDYEQILRKNDSVNAELVARKVEYPDDNTRVIVETRCLPDGTRVTSTRREFRAPAQSTRSEYQTRSESKSYSSQHKSDTKDSTYKTTHHITDNRTNDIVDSQRNVDDHDFKRQLRQYTSKDNDDYSDNQQRNVTQVNKKVSDYSQTDSDHSQHRYESRVSNKVVDHSNTKKDEHIQTQHQIIDRRNDHLVDEVDRHHFNTTMSDHDSQHKVFKETCHIDDTEERILNVSREKKDTRNEKRHTSRDRLVTGERVTDITRDKPISVETIHDIPKHSFAPTDHDIPRDSRVPEDRARDIPRNTRVPEERARDIPRDARVPEERARDIPRDARVPEETAHDIPRERVVPEDDTVRVPYRDRNITDERVHKITRDTKVDEVIERKTSSDHYQTTYQNDFQSRKISTDWSPTHQAWASTLRSDTPSTTRPSTRASSPGSRTFKSSTSSLRSSVSPDKSSRKPSSRGGSPNKVDRYSPTRTVSSDRHSSTHSTHSVTEVRTNKNTSPERKPPTGRSSAKPGYSPDRKQQDLHRQRPSASPEKKPKNLGDRPSLSPERKPSHKSTPNDKQPRAMSPSGKRGHPKSSAGPTQSPERKPTYQPSDENPSYTHRQASPYRSTSSPDKKPIDGYPNRTSPRSSPSPDNKLGRQKPTDSPTTNFPKTYSPSQPRYPTNDAPQKSGTIPDQKLSYLTQPDQPGRKSDRPIDNSTSTRSSASPDRKPGYMKPTAASQPDNKTRRPSKPEDELDRKSPKQVPAQSPDRMFHDLNKTIKIKEDHYRFVDEETKTYIHTDKTDINKIATITPTSDNPRPRDKSFSPIRKVPSEDSPGFNKVPLNKTMSPSMKENTTVFTENDEHYETKTVETTDTSNKQDAYIANITTEKRTPQVEEHPSEKELPNRETSPSKFGTYDKKKPRDITETTEKTIISTEDTKDVKYDSSTRRDKTMTKKISDVPSPPYQKSPRDSTSPLKSPTKDTKYKDTTEFLASERTTEKVNKKSPTKTHPRQLLTPSTSPTRKPKTTETEPSTGQSSPTTSVSGFVYFGSPRTEKPMVTDLDEFYPDLQNTEEASKRPESLDVKKSPSPSKIPCRSPSPEKHVPVTKDSLPRKSSLKKPSTDQNQSSPLEKPPTSFRVSPTDDKPEVPGDKVAKKNVSSEPETGEPKTSESGTTSKPKPPLQRRETYEDRCKKILGMADDTTTDSLTRVTTKTKKIDSSQSSPSVSPCYSPAPKDTSPFPDYPCTNKVTTTKTNVTDFIAHEQEDITSKTYNSKRAKILSRESSPTNIKKPTLIGDKISKKNVERDTKGKNPSTRRSPDKTLSQPPDKTSYDSYPHENFSQEVLTDTIKKQPSKSPERKVTSSPSKQSRPAENAPARSLLSPERKLEGKFPEENSPSKTTLQKSMGSSKTTTSEISEYDSTYATDFVEESTKTTKSIVDKSQPSKVIESPSRKSPKIFPEQSDNLRTTSPSRSQPKDNSPVRKSVPRDQTVESDHPRDRDLKHEDEHPKDIKRGKPSESITTITSKYDSTTENVDETYMTRIQEKKKPQSKTPSPTRHTPQAAPQEGAPNRTSQPISTSQKRLDTSLQRNLPKDGTAMKTSHEEPKDSHSTKPRDIPGYMKTTAAMNKKFDTITVSEKVYETNKSKTINSKYDSPGQPDSPSRKSAELKITSNHRASSPTKSTRSPDISPDRKHKPSQQPSSSIKESPVKNLGSKYSEEPLPTRPSPEKIPGYMKTTSSVSSKYNTTEYDSLTTENIQELITSTTIETDYPEPRKSESPTRQNLKSYNASTSEHLRKNSPSKSSRPSYDTLKEEKLTPEQKHESKHPKSLKNTLADTKMTTTVTSSFDNSTVESIEENVNSKSIKKKYSSETLGQISSKTGERPRTLSPVKSTDNYRTSTKSPDQKSSPKSPVKDISLPEDKNPKHRAPERFSVSPERPGYMKLTTSLISKIDNTMIQDKQDVHVSRVIKEKSPSLVSTDHQSSECPDYVLGPEEPRQLRTPSPVKKTTKLTEVNTDFLISEREQEIINKVQRSLRKLSPERKERTPSRERSPNKTTTSLQDLDIITTETTQTDNQTNEDLSEILEEHITRTSKISHPKQPKGEKLVDNKSPNKTSSRNVSPVKKTASVPTPNKIDKSPESPTKPRSISPKKPGPQVEHPQSPQVPKSSGIKPREQIPAHLTRKPTPATLSPTKIDRLTTDVKKTTGVTKQNISIKTSTSKTLHRAVSSTTNKTNEPEFKQTQNSKSVKDSVSPKKDAVTRTTSDIVMRPKKTSSPQRMKSKPDIQVIDMSTKSPKVQKSIVKEPHSKLPSKPKSATALNTSIDEDDIIIDVQQSKSSRENSPDRICPTPINFCDDVGVPRFPDEVSEPDDELDKRAHHTIHETESVVDDIVEIDEDEELFLKRTEMDGITEYDESLLSVNDKVSKFTNKISSVSKPKDTTTTFNNNEKRVHSDFIDDNLKSDECLLTVSEKVNKFAKGPRDTKGSRSPSRKITDEYDRDTVYQDDYTKLSVNDKAHLFIETAENVKMTKVKPAQKVERPDFTHVDESLKSDNCLLSVSDKVSKFVKTTEQYFTETQEVDETEKKIKDQHEKIMKQIIEDDDDENCNTNEIAYTEETSRLDETSSYHEDRSKPRTKEPKTSQPKVKGLGSPSSKPAERVPAVKITTLRSSEAVKKVKALFENIASTQKSIQKETTSTTKTTKLTDIGVIKKSPKTDSTTVLHPSVEDVFPQVTDIEIEMDTSTNSKERPSSGTLTKPQRPRVHENKPQSSPSRLAAQSPDIPRSKSSIRQNVEETTAKTVLSRYPAVGRAESPKQRIESPSQRAESPRQQRAESPRQQRAESPRQRTESPRYHAESPRQRTESPRQRHESDKLDKVPGYLRPTKTSQIKEETKIIEESEVSSRRGSGKFGVELRRTSVERSTISSERRRSVEHHQPCIEDIYDLDLLEQMLEKVVGYEQRRRIRAQIRVAKQQSEQIVDSNTYTRTTKQTTTALKTRSPERTPQSQKTSSPDRHSKSTSNRTTSERPQPKESTINGHAKEPVRSVTVTKQRPHSPEKTAPKSTLAPKTPVRQPSPDKRRTTSPSKSAPKPKGNRFNEYASAYMKKVGLTELEKVKFSNNKTKKTTDAKHTVKHERQQETVQEFSTTRSFTDRTSSKDVIELVQTNGKRSPSPELRYSPERKVQFPERIEQVPERKALSPERKAQSPVRKAQSPVRKPQSPVRKSLSPERKPQSPELRTHSPERKAQSPERLHQRTPSPDFKRPKANTIKETVTKTTHDIEKKIPAKPVQEEKPSWVTNRNLKKITSETRTYSSKKIENEKPKYRAPSPSKVVSKPIDVITSSYGPGPLDADGKPLFGIKALRNGASNFQVKGTVIRQEFHSRNGGEPEGTVSVTAYSTQPEELEQLLTSQGGEPPSRIHGLAAITTTKKFGGDTGNTISNVHTKEERASLEQFTHHDRRVEHLESQTYDTSSQEYSEDTRREHISGSTRRIESRKEDRQSDRNDRSTRREERVTEVKSERNLGEQKVDERREKMEKREDKKTVRQSSVKSLTEKYIKSANDSGKADRTHYPKAGLILRTTTMRDSVSSEEAHPDLVRTDSEHSLGSVDDTVVTTTERTDDGVRTTTTRTSHHHGPTVTTHTRGSTVITHHEPVITTKKTSTVITQEPVITRRVIRHEPVVKITQGHQGSTVTTERSFLDSTTKVSGVQDILTRMKNADIVIQEGDSTEDAEARALLNKFLGATVLMAGMQGYVSEQPGGNLLLNQETVRSTSSGGKVTSRTVEELDLDQCWDERLLKKLLDECTDYEQRRRLRARIRTLMAEQEACASAVTEALGVGSEGGEGSEAREEEEVTVTSSVRRDSSDKTVSSSTTTKTSKVMEMTRSAPKPVSPFAKFRQLEKQNSTNSPNSPKTPQSPGSPSQPYFKFTDPALQSSALTIKERLLQWCRDKTRDYENVKLENFSTSWADGLAFCALVHHFLPDAFDYSKLTADRRRHNFTLAFKVADEKAGIYPLLDVDDMVAMRKPDWKCVFTYVQAIYRRFKDE